ncbi:MAG: T9SS C-terminal target domain-containing protein [Ignavibacteriae bacterium]|nr:MAG: T9SS C-terminal target domain-containing protein [Ignavibacteriota bacterium]
MNKIIIRITYIYFAVFFLLVLFTSHAGQNNITYRNISGAVNEPCDFVWSAQQSGVTNVLTTVKAVNDLTGWAAGNEGVIKTTDGGSNWISASASGQLNGTVFCIEAIDSINAWVSTTPSATCIFKTTNGGVNWIQVFNQANGFINGIQMINAETGYACGDPVGGVWTLIKTTNGGDNWTQISSAPPQINNEFGFNNTFKIIGTNMWFATNLSHVYVSTNLGLNWISSLTPGLDYIFTLHFNNDTCGIVTGSTALITTNGGTYWAPVTGTIPGSGDMFGAEGFGSEYFWILRGSGIYSTSNGGINWKTVTEITPSGELYAIDFAVSSGCPGGWVVSNDGSVYAMKFVTGINNTGNNIPASFILEQNYPNPFNPKTIINYQLAMNSDVKLSIIDITGKEIAVLVNENQNAGSYNVEWDASDYSSGVYFYQITADPIGEAGNFSASKKMLLIK